MIPLHKEPAQLRLNLTLPLPDDNNRHPLYGKYQEHQKDLSKVFEQVLRAITETHVDVDLTRDAIAIENLREHTEKENSLLVFNPALAKEWNYGKNGSLKPEHITASSNKKVWWICSNGHEWQATVYI